MQIAVILCAVLCAAAAVVFIRLSYTGGALQKLAAKAVASALFVLLGVLCVFAGGFGRGMVFSIWALLGLVLGFWGDVLLECQDVFPQRRRQFFLAGVGAFFLGHVCYCFALAQLGAPGALHWLAGAGVLVLALLLQRVGKVEPGPMRGPVYAYAAIISVMAGFAVGAVAAEASVAALLLFFGALLFLVSDAILAYMYFGPKDVAPLRAWNLGTYYLAQILIALSIWAFSA